MDQEQEIHKSLGRGRIGEERKKKRKKSKRQRSKTVRRCMDREQTRSTDEISAIIPRLTSINLNSGPCHRLTE